MKITENESIFCQALAMTTLLGELSNNDFLHSTYYKKLSFTGNGDNFKKILEASGLGNPATMQMYLYVLLVMPKETLKDYDNTFMGGCETEINQMFSELAHEVKTSYKNENQNDITTINFYRHTRNAIAHSKCNYKTIGNICYVTFNDVNPHDIDQHCEISIETSKVGVIIEKLQILLMNYLNAQWSTR